MSDTRWMTYDELATALGITGDSARRLVARKRWPRKPGNDGKARIGVPAERIPDKTPDVAPDSGPDVIWSTPPVPPDVPPGSPFDILPVVRVLGQHIERLEREIEAVKQERDAERARAADLAAVASQVDALNAVLDLERKRLEDLRADRDRWVTQAERLAAPPRGWWPFRRAR